MKFDKLIQADLENIRSLQPDGWPDIVLEFDKYIKQGFCYPIKAVIEDTIVGVGSAIAFKTTGWLAHIIVDKNHRNQGIGFQIVNELINILKHNNLNTFLLIATEIGTPVYVKAGFRTVTEYIFLKRQNPWFELPLSEYVIPYQEKYYTAIMEMDKEISGENREVLIKNRLNDSFLYVENRKLLGYYIPGLGEGLIVGDNKKSGLELMKIKHSTADKAVIPYENQTAIKFLKANGFKESETTGTRMIMGNEIQWKPEKVFGRIGGNYG
jgi:GNAT superfamily N-acetyltransferase